MPVHHVIGNTRMRIVVSSKESDRRVRAMRARSKRSKPWQQWFPRWFMHRRAYRRGKTLCGPPRIMDNKGWGYGYWYKEIIGPFDTADALLEALHDRGK